MPSYFVSGVFHETSRIAPASSIRYNYIISYTYYCIILSELYALDHTYETLISTSYCLISSAIRDKRHNHVLQSDDYMDATAAASIAEELQFNLGLTTSDTLLLQRLPISKFNTACSKDLIWIRFNTLCNPGLTLHKYNSSWTYLFVPQGAQEHRDQTATEALDPHPPPSWFVPDKIKEKDNGDEILLKSISVELAPTSTMKVVLHSFTNIENFLLYQTQHEYVLSQREAMPKCTNHNLVLNDTKGLKVVGLQADSKEETDKAETKHWRIWMICAIWWHSTWMLSS